MFSLGLGNLNSFAERDSQPTVRTAMLRRMIVTKGTGATTLACLTLVNIDHICECNTFWAQWNVSKLHLQRFTKAHMVKRLFKVNSFVPRFVSSVQGSLEIGL